MEKNSIENIRLQKIMRGRNDVAALKTRQYRRRPQLGGRPSNKYASNFSKSKGVQLKRISNNKSWFQTIQWPRPLAGLRGLKPKDLPREVAAGLTLAALVIPLNIGYAQVAGVSPVVGLYAGILPLAVFALLTSSRHVVSSPDASMAALIGAALLGMAVPGDMRLHYTLAITLMCGLLLLTFWYFRLAFLANFLSRPVLVGFFSGLGIEVFANQLRKILGATAVKVSEVEAVATEIKEVTSHRDRGIWPRTDPIDQCGSPCESILCDDRPCYHRFYSFDEALHPQTAGGASCPGAGDGCGRLFQPG